MNAFLGISKSQTTNLAWSRPASPSAAGDCDGGRGAIPRVMIYNMFAGAITAIADCWATAPPN